MTDYIWSAQEKSGTEYYEETEEEEKDVQSLGQLGGLSQKYDGALG